MSRLLTRRELVGIAGAGVVVGAARFALPTPAFPGVVGTAGLTAGTVSPQTCRQAMTAAMAAATGAESGARGSAKLFTAGDTVGIKVNCLAGPAMSPRVELVEALVELIAAAGVDRHRIIVFDRSSRELERAGFEVRKTGGPYLCYGIDNDYDRRPTTSGQIGSCYARLVSEECTALISFGVVKDHDLAGVSAGLKNWYGVIHNPNKYHDSNCDPYVADVVAHRHVSSKLRLTVLDGVKAECQGGPALYRAGLFDLGRVVASTDPVAADLWAWQQIDGERQRRGLPILSEVDREPRFISTAARRDLGVGEAGRLRVVAG